MCAGADSIDDLDLGRAGGMKPLFRGVYAQQWLTLWRNTIGYSPSTATARPPAETVRAPVDDVILPRNEPLTPVSTPGEVRCGTVLRVEVEG